MGGVSIFIFGSLIKMDVSCLLVSTVHKGGHLGYVWEQECWGRAEERSRRVTYITSTLRL